jgi:signal transduction histidine kinase
VPRVTASVRLWQTGLFVVVIVVAALIVAGSLTAGLTTSLSEQAKSEELRGATLLAARIEAGFSSTRAGIADIRGKVAEYRAVYTDGVWVFDAQGNELVSAYSGTPDKVRIVTASGPALAGTAYTDVQLTHDGWAIAAAPVVDRSGRPMGAVVTEGPVATSLAVLDAARSRLWVTFWAALIFAGLIGFAFSEFISRRISAMSKAATAIADGDFSLRLPTGLVPDEIHDLAEGYNRMAVRLGAAFSAIQASEREIATVVESMAEGVVAFDVDGTVRIINPEAMRLLGDPVTDLIGVPARVITGDPAVLDAISAGLSGAAVSATVALGSRTVLLHCTPLQGEAGHVGGAVLLMADVTEQRRVEEAQRRFVADASHEMRTPVAALRGMLELLADGAKDDPTVRDDFLATMLLETERLGRLIADLLTLAQLEAGSLRLDRQPQSAESLLQDVAHVMGPLAERADVALSVECDAGDATVSADRDRIVQVLIGFTDNALKHSPRGTTVHLRALRHDETVGFEVADEGHGIPPEQLEHIFDRFYRADESRGGRGGAGLGLAIAKEIVDAHGAEIRVSSAPGRGTTFCFELPPV